MAPSESFDDFLARLRTGDDAAATEVFRRYTDRLVALARSRLETSLRGKVDAEDVVQSAYRSFFTRARAGQYDLESWETLWSLLAVITLRKCVNRVEFFHAGRRDAALETPLDVAWHTALDREPSPTEAAVLAETVEQLLRGLDPPEREVVELSLQGCTAQEISEQLGRAERTVRRVRQFVRERLERMRAE